MKKILTLCAALVAAMSMSAQDVKTMTCEEARNAALALQEGATGDETVAVTGYITETNGAVSRKQQCFYMDDEKGSGKQTFYAYWCNLPEEDTETPLAVGDKIILTGKLVHYVKGDNHIAQMKNAAVTVLERVVVNVDTFHVDICEGIEEALALNKGDYSTDYYEVTGIVSQLDQTDEEHHQQSFFMECDGMEDNFKAHYCTINGDFVALGDEVKVLGKLTNFNGQAEIANGKAWVSQKGNVKIDTFQVTVAEALAAAKALENGKISKDVYVVTGYIDSISSKYSEQYKNISFYMCDDLKAPAYEFQAYRVKGGADLKVGDKVAVKGNVMHFWQAATDTKEEKHAYQMNAGATYEIIPATAVENVVNNNASKAVKVIKNGQLVIIRNGVEYNTVGVAL